MKDKPVQIKKVIIDGKEFDISPPTDFHESNTKPVPDLYETGKRLEILYEGATGHSDQEALEALKHYKGMKELVENIAFRGKGSAAQLFCRRLIIKIRENRS